MHLTEQNANPSDSSRQADALTAEEVVDAALSRMSLDQLRPETLAACVAYAERLEPHGIEIWQLEELLRVAFFAQARGQDGR